MIRGTRFIEAGSAPGLPGGANGAALSNVPMAEVLPQAAPDGDELGVGVIGAVVDTLPAASQSDLLTDDVLVVQAVHPGQPDPYYSAVENRIERRFSGKKSVAKRDGLVGGGVGVVAAIGGLVGGSGVVLVAGVVVVGLSVVGTSVRLWSLGNREQASRQPQSAVSADMFEPLIGQPIESTESPSPQARSSPSSEAASQD